MGLEQKLGNMGVVTTSLEKAVGWARSNAIWPMLFGLACCAIEMMSTQASRYDLSRFGMELMRASPRQSDLMIVAGRVSRKMAPVLRNLYDQMPEPRYVVAMGACASCGGVFNNYAIVQGVDEIVPVDVYVAGCPPRPEALLHSFIKLQEKIEKQTLRDVPWYQKGAEDVVPIPVLGPDLVDLRRAEEIKSAAAQANVAA